MQRHSVVLAMLGCCAALGACATVSVYEPVATAEISLTARQSTLHKAAEEYCVTARERGLATGEASLGQIANLLTGKTSDENAYWRRIGADRAAPGVVTTRLRGDAVRMAAGLADLDAMARKLLDAEAPNKDDVTQFELALIHARQARDSLSDAISQLNDRDVADLKVATELAALDAALASARMTADDLASARPAAGTGASLALGAS